MGDGDAFSLQELGASINMSTRIVVNSFRSCTTCSRWFPLCGVSGFLLDVRVWPNHNSSVWLEFSRADEVDADSIDVDEVVSRISCEAFMPSWRQPEGGRVVCSDRVAERPKIEGERDSHWIRLAAVKELDQRGLLAKDRLHLLVHLTMEALPESVGGPPVATESAPAAALASDLGCLLSSGSFTDITVVAGDKEIPAHRCVLAARAPVFHKMMTAGMSEAASERIEVSDTDAVTIQAVLSFLYTGSCTGALALNESPVGEWHYQGGDKLPGMGVKPTGQYTILELDGGLTFLERMESSGGDAEFQGSLKQQGDGEWVGELEGMAVVNLHLRHGVMHCLFRRDRATEVNVTRALCAAKEVHDVERWGRLLVAADMYCISGLVEVCKDSMLRRLNVYSAACMLRFVGLTSLQDFKAEILDFIALDEDRFGSVKDTREFDLLDPDLAAEVTEVFLDRCRRKRRRLDSSHAPEFPDSQDWGALSNAQLRRACLERGLATGGKREALLGLLSAQAGKDGHLEVTST